MPSQLWPQWHCDKLWYMMNYLSCAQAHELLQSHCGDNQEGTLSWKDFERIFNQKV